MYSSLLAEPGAGDAEPGAGDTLATELTTDGTCDADSSTGAKRTADVRTLSPGVLRLRICLQWV